MIKRLADDFIRIEREAEFSLKFHQQILSYLKTLSASLDSGVIAVSDKPSIDRALIVGLSIQTSADSSSTFAELISSGRINLLDDVKLIQLLIDYEDFLKRYGVNIRFHSNKMVNI